MSKITSKDIELVKEYIEQIKVLHSMEPAKTVTDEEWKEFFSIYEKTGEIPEKYRGKIAKKEETVYIDRMEKPTDEGRIKTIFYDRAYEKVNAEYYELQRKYKEPLIKILINALEKTNEAIIDNNNQDITELIKKLLQELEKNPEQAEGMEALASIPNGDPLNLLYKILNNSGRAEHLQNNHRKNRHENIQVLQDTKTNRMRFIRENKQNGSSIIIDMDQADKYLQKSNRTFSKVLLFTLQKMTAQHFPLEVGFSLQELVDVGMYSHVENARKAVKDFFIQQKGTVISGIVKRGKKTVKEEGGILFYHYNINNNYVKLSVNENFNMEFIAGYFTVFPRFAFALGINAFSLVRYIVSLARQNTQKIAERGYFTISLDSVRENLGLPAPEEVKNRKYRQYIIEPIENAIEEIETASAKLPEASECAFTITPHVSDTSKINEWLEGYLEIGMNGAFAETFTRIENKARQEREQFERAKIAAIAKIEARKEENPAKNAP